MNPFAHAHPFGDEGAPSMLPALLRRDLKTHRRILIGACVSLALILATGVLALWAEPSNSEQLQVFLGMGLFLASLLAISLQLRESMADTLGDLLALPVSRREIVRLRYLEGLLACALYVPFYLVVCGACFHLSPRALAHLLHTPALFWIPAGVLGYLLPFGMRGMKSLAGAYLSLCACGLPLILISAFRASWMDQLQQFTMAVSQVWDQLHGHLLSACLVDYVLPCLVLAASYHLAVWFFERVQA